MSEAVDVIRALWDVDRRERIKYEGEFYRVVGARTFEYGTSAFILMSDDASTIARYGQEVAPAVRDLVATERAAATRPPRGPLF